MAAAELATIEQAPKRNRRTKEEMEALRSAGLEPRKERAPRKPKISVGKVAGVLKAGITMIDRGLLFLAPAIWQPEDALRPSEAELLAAASAAELARYPKAIDWLSKAGEFNSHAQLAYALMAIASPRLARRGIIPVELSNALITGGMVAGATPGDHRSNGDGENNPG